MRAGDSLRWRRCDDPEQFQDVDPGSHVVCVAFDRTAMFGCTCVVVLDGDPAQEITFKVSPVSP